MRERKLQARKLYSNFHSFVFLDRRERGDRGEIQARESHEFSNSFTNFQLRIHKPICRLQIHNYPHNLITSHYITTTHNFPLYYALITTHNYNHNYSLLPLFGTHTPSTNTKYNKNTKYTNTTENTMKIKAKIFSSRS